MHLTADPSILAPLWLRARAMFARARAAIGEPATIAARTALARDTRRDIAGWLARLESIVRKLLLAIAAGLVEEQRRNAGPKLEIVRLAQPPMALPQNHRIDARPRPIDRTQPETWPARFALAPPRDPRVVPDSRAPRIRALWGPTPPAPAAPPPRAPRRATQPALRFALRLEALRRVLADPIPHAQRLARIFQRLSRRYPGAAPRFAIAPTRPCLADPVDPRLIVEAIAAAISAAPVLANTS